MAGNSENRVNKRSSYACTRCKRQKIKCSGQQPCANCAKRNLVCVVNESEIKVVVTRGYLSALQAKVARLEHHIREETDSAPHALHSSSRLLPEDGNEAQTSLPSGHHEQIAQPRDDTNDTADGSLLREDDTDSDAPKLANPLSITAAPKYMSSSKGLKSYLGPSSNWSFHGRVLNLVHTHAHHTPFPSSDFLFEGEAYGLPWTAETTASEPSKALVPTIDHAVFLINAVKFHCTQLLHLFDEEEFNMKLQAFYSSTDDMSETDLWYIQFLLLIALGKALVQNKHQGPRPPGSELFQRARRLLPDTDTLCREPMIAMETLCCIALYLHALDSRNAAHVTIGQAMRIGLANGMHTNMPIHELGEPLVQRCRKIWWTVCLLDRQMTSLMGIPQSIRPEEITCQLPDFHEAPQRKKALEMQIKLSRVYADIARNVYGLNHQLHRAFVANIKSVLDTLTALAEELRNAFPLQTNRGMSRLSAHLHLQHLQMVVLVTRPILFCCLELVLQNPVEASRLTTSSKVRHLIAVSSEAGQNMLNIVLSLQDQGLLEAFLPWGFDALFVSTTVLILVRFINGALLSDGTECLKKAFEVFEYMIVCGNDVARHRVKELRTLEEMLVRCKDAEVARASARATAGRQLGVCRTEGSGIDQHHDCTEPQVFAQVADPNGDGNGFESSFGIPMDGSSGFGLDLPAEQILAMADGMDIEDTEWMTLVMCEPGFDVQL